ncbi:similar to Saccharomyces cerevisiae YKR076W ECM4 Omega class glutathione transferase [Maudiozyma barnettii]|uniref:Similar to Saccharomyces cerevisiae YKR076W ECM4 Omega class glutathione transferase n=1 Tax=Maudiozyma barnettii TaxID=61262 RepID=A0A8H2ZIT8_9SACH|nr:uncharacterized protein KABA2_07S06028 [Kazachstania barnettii]CAB4255857.1 similar to Saccharomyces cerevisiae YKR076W ECM4 Omega class glutathione transferase [Kazachstania barnettii]CAD1784417.1 similar to Saccharomyces cerevisiae YKR076W ECM4 Omega class glutathione transferase [Kazachstania barnettii]
MSKDIVSFNETISPDHPVYKPEKGRYWLYIAAGCPYASRALITRALKGLNNVIGVSVAQWMLGDEGWKFLQADPKEMGENAYKVDGGVHGFKDDTSGPIGDLPDDSSRLFIDGSFDPNYGVKSVKELYMMSNKDYKGSFSVPILWDLKTKTIVNNDSGEIIRILNSSFNEFIDPNDAEKNVDLAPKDLIKELDDYNQWLGPNINYGVYKVGLAKSQSIFEEETIKLYNSLDKVENKLKLRYEKLSKEYKLEDEILKKFFLFVDHITDADIRLFTTIIRFDSVYSYHFTCNYKLIRTDYPLILKWLKNLYWNHPSFKETTNFDHIKLFYTRSRKLRNTLSLTPLGPKHDIPTL